MILYIKFYIIKWVHNFALAQKQTNTIPSSNSQINSQMINDIYFFVVKQIDIIN